MSEICHRIHVLFSKLPELEFPFDSSMIPRNGIYILFEKGEVAHGTDRIVRVTLRAMLVQERIPFRNPNKIDRAHELAAIRHSRHRLSLQ